MKKSAHLVIALFVLFAWGCGLKDIVKPKSTSVLSDSYQLVGKGSTWKYKLIQPGTDDDEVNTTITGDTKLYNGKVYYKSTSVHKYDNSITLDYYTRNGHAYYLRSVDADTQFDNDNTLELQYLDDTLPVGATWTLQANDSGIYQGSTTRSLTTILEKGITKTVNTQTFTNVIHTQTQVQFDLGTGYVTFTTMDYYVAKGVGVIEMDISAFGVQVAQETLVSYSIK